MKLLRIIVLIIVIYFLAVNVNNYRDYERIMTTSSETDSYVIGKVYDKGPEYISAFYYDKQGTMCFVSLSGANVTYTNNTTNTVTITITTSRNKYGDVVSSERDYAFCFFVDTPIASTSWAEDWLNGGKNSVKNDTEAEESKPMSPGMTYRPGGLI
jgi:hypothetical protein